MKVLNESDTKRFHCLACLIIVLAGLIIYSNTVHSSFHFDDYRNIVDNPLIRDLRNVPQLFQKTRLHDNNFTLPSRGLVTTSFAVNYYFSGLSVEEFHWVNISLHLINSMFVYFLAIIILNKYFSVASGRDTSMGRVLALFVALFFLTSPIQTQSVTYIYQRNGLMTSFFYLLSLILFIRAVTGPGIRAYLSAGSVLSFLFATWCKEIAHTAPLIMFLYYQCFIAGEWRSLGKGLWLVLPYVVLSAVSFYLGVKQYPLVIQTPDWGPWEYLLTQSNVLIEYIKLLLLPLPGRLNVDVDFPLAETLWEFPTLISAVFVVAVLVTAVLLLNRARLLAFSILWFFVILAPTSSIIPLRDAMVHRRLYLPGFAFYLLLVVGVHKALCYLGERTGLEPRRIWQAELAVLTGIVLFYSTCTYERNKVWKTDITLWEDTVKKSPSKVRPHYTLGLAYEKKGLVDRAKKEYLRCKELYAEAPNMRNWGELKWCSLACNNLGSIFNDAGMYNQAIRECKEALQIYPDYAKAHTNLGLAYSKKGMYNLAIKCYQEAVHLKPDLAEAHNNLGNVYGLKGLYDEAIREFEEAIRLKPDLAETHNNLAWAYGNKGLHDLEIKHYEEAIRLKPDYAAAYYNLGLAYGQKGLYDEAIRQFEEVVRLKPGDAEAYYNLAQAYGMKGLYDKAIKNVEQALRLKPGFQEARKFLQLLYQNKR